MILPVRHAAAGGYVLKLRNSAGDRVVHAPDFFREHHIDEASEATSTIEVETISPTFERSSPATVTIAWEDSIFANGFDP